MTYKLDYCVLKFMFPCISSLLISSVLPETQADGKIRTKKPYHTELVTIESDFKLDWYEMFQVS